VIAVIAIFTGFAVRVLCVLFNAAQILAAALPACRDNALAGSSQDFAGDFRSSRRIALDGGRPQCPHCT
jgi:hypothetical protein